MVKKLGKDILGFTKASITLGVGSSIAAGTGGYASAGLSAAGGMMPAVGTALVGGHVVRLTKKLKRRVY